jgi:hypothetical protein
MAGFARTWSFGVASGKADIPPRALWSTCPRNHSRRQLSATVSTRQSAASFTLSTNRHERSFIGVSTATTRRPSPLTIRPPKRWATHGHTTFGRNVITDISRRCAMARSGVSALSFIFPALSPSIRRPLYQAIGLPGIMSRCSPKRIRHTSKTSASCGLFWTFAAAG